MKNKPIKIIRLIILGVFLVAISVVAYLHQTGKGVIPSIHALCPFGGLESLYTFFTTGSFISKIFAGTMVLFFVTLLLAILFRRSFCGLICPFGAMQEFFGMLGRKLMGKQIKMPAVVDKPLRWLKYIILAVTVIFAFFTAGLWMESYDPWAAYAHLSTGLASVWVMFPIGLILLIVTIIGSIVYDRFLCKYICPMGAFYGIVGKISPHKVTRNADSCTNCGICSKKCPMNIDVATKTAVTSAECIGCQKCVANCPSKGALSLKTAKYTVNSVAIILVLALFFVPLFISQSVGAFSGGGGGMRMEDGQSGGMNMENGQQAGGTDQQAGGLDFSGIMGRNTLQDAANIWGIDIKEVYQKLGIPETVPADTMMKDIKNYVPTFDFEKLKGH